MLVSTASLSGWENSSERSSQSGSTPATPTIENLAISQKKSQTVLEKLSNDGILAPEVGCVDGIKYALYAQYLYDVKDDVAQAKVYFERASEYAKDDAWVQALYGTFCMDTETCDAKAEQHLARALQIDPKQPLAMGNIGVLLHKQQDRRDEALKKYSKHLQVYPEHASIWTRKGNLLKHSLRDYKGAKLCFDNALKGGLREELSNFERYNSDCLSSYALLNHGILNDQEGAKEMYEAAVKENPYSCNILSNYALYLSDTDVVKAERLYKRAFHISGGKHANTCYNWGCLRDSLEDSTGAKELYQRAVEADPKHAFAHYNLAVLYQESGDFDLAKEAYEKSLEINPNDPMTLCDFGAFHLKVHKNLLTAEKLTRKALKVSNDTYAPAWFKLGIIFKHRGEFEVAQDSFEKCLSFVSDYDTNTAEDHAALVGSLGNLANIYADIHDDTDRAYRYYNRAISLEEHRLQATNNYNSKIQLSELLINLADLVFDVMGDPEESAGQIYERAKRAAPNNPYILHNCSIYYQSQGQNDKAIDMLKHAVANNKPEDTRDCKKQLEMLLAP